MLKSIQILLFHAWSLRRPVLVRCRGERNEVQRRDRDPVDLCNLRNRVAEGKLQRLVSGGDAHEVRTIQNADAEKADVFLREARLEGAVERDGVLERLSVEATGSRRRFQARQVPGRAEAGDAAVAVDAGRDGDAIGVDDGGGDGETEGDVGRHDVAAGDDGNNGDAIFAVLDADCDPVHS